MTSEMFAYNVYGHLISTAAWTRYQTTENTTAHVVKSICQEVLYPLLQGFGNMLAFIRFQTGSNRIGVTNSLKSALEYYMKIQTDNFVLMYIRPLDLFFQSYTDNNVRLSKEEINFKDMPAALLDILPVCYDKIILYRNQASRYISEDMERLYAFDMYQTEYATVPISFYWNAPLHFVNDFSIGITYANAVRGQIYGSAVEQVTHSAGLAELAVGSQLDEGIKRFENDIISIRATALTALKKANVDLINSLGSDAMLGASLLQTPFQTFINTININANNAIIGFKAIYDRVKKSPVFKICYSLLKPKGSKTKPKKEMIRREWTRTGSPLREGISADGDDIAKTDVVLV